MTLTPFHPYGDPVEAEGIHVEETVDGVRYILPGRVLGGGHVFGAALSIFGLVVALAALWWGVAQLGNGMHGTIVLIAGMVLPAVVLLIGAFLWAAGMFIAMGRTELELRGDRLRRVERAGLLRWTRSRPIANLVRLRIATGLSPDQSINEAMLAGTSLSISGGATGPARLMGEYESGRTISLLIGYPQAWLSEVANDLADRLARHPAHQRHAGDRPEVLVRDSGEPRRQAEAEPEVQPHDSTIEIAKSREGLTISIPPLSILRDRSGAVSIGAAWNGFMAFLTGGAFTFMHMPWQINLGVAMFWVVSIAVLLLAVARGRRSAIIDIVDETMLITQRSFTGVRQRTWRRDELRTIECGPSGMEVNERPVMQLQITPASGGTAGYFTGRDEQELRWLARILREAMNLPKGE